MHRQTGAAAAASPASPVGQRWMAACMHARTKPPLCVSCVSSQGVCAAHKLEELLQLDMDAGSLPRPGLKGYINTCLSL